jgi:hypothetical protein
MSDLTERLRNPPVMSMALNRSHLTQMWMDSMTEAADALDAKEAEIAVMRKALVWIRENPQAHPSNMVAVARTALF